MNDESLLLRPILEDPSDDTARLIYADYVEDHGDHEYATFIRRQIAKPAEVVTRFPRAAPGMRERPVVKCYFNRGFLFGIEMGCREFLGKAANLFQQFPVTAVTLADKIPASHDDHTGRRWSWWSALFAPGGLRSSSNPVWQLPHGVWAALDAKPILAWSLAKDYPLRQSAFIDLSQTCVRLGRRWAGLPALPPGRPLPVPPACIWDRE